MNSNNSTIVIDNGTYECRAGYQSNLKLKFPNRFFKTKENVNFIAPSHGSSEKNMFDENVITNFENAEIIFDHIFEKLELKKPNELILTENAFTPFFSRKKLIELFFELYGFKKIQFGIDAVYAMLKNKVFGPALSVGMSNSAITVIDIDKKIKSVDVINFGAKQCKTYVQALLNNKYVYTKISKEYADEIVENLAVCVEYDKEVEEILEKIRLDEFFDDFEPTFLKAKAESKTDNKSAEKKKNAMNFARKKGKLMNEEKMKKENFEDESKSEVEEMKSEIEEIKSEIEEIKSEVEEIKSVEILTEEEEIAKRRKEKIAYFSSVYRLKVKITKAIEKMAVNLELLKEKYEIETNLPNYILGQKKKVEILKNRIQLRNNVIRELRNKKSAYVEVKNKDPSNGYSEKEFEMINQIEWASDKVAEEKDYVDLDELVIKIKKYEPNYEAYEYTTYQLLYGFGIERRKVAEIIFQPSIINLECKGLSEIIEMRKPKNIFVSGGFSNIKNLKERIIFEAQPYLDSNDPVNVIFAEDSVYDAFYGAQFTDLFPIFTQDEYNEKGVENLVTKFEF